ncbi:MAG: acyl-CoA thioesterase II [Nocardioides sp.]
MPGTIQELIGLFDLEVLDVNLFRGTQPSTGLPRVFGGQVAAQALVAATNTATEGFVAHSLHSYFLLPGDPEVPIVYDVERLRDGRSFGTRRVVARQHGRPIYYQTVNFQKPESGLEHQDVMPEGLGPEESLSMADILRMRGVSGAERWEREWAALDVRYAGTSTIGLPEDPEHPARARIWMRVAGTLPDEAIAHQAAFTYASDLTLLGASLLPHGVNLASPGMQIASLDHSIWFHQPFAADKWWLYDQVSPVAHGGRGLALARVFTQDGTLVATTAQEGLIRRRD